MKDDIINKSVYVREYDYNNIDYDNGKNRFSSTEELERYLDKVFIPKYVAYTRIDNNNYGEGKKLSIQFNRILGLKCSESELKYILQYLCDRDIYVGGIVSTLEGEHNNYDYKHTYRLSSFPSCMKWEEQKELFDKYIEYKKTNNPKKHDIAKKIAEGCLRLVRYITYRYALFTEFDINELDSYGCEGLMEAIDKFDPSLGYKFSTFAFSHVKNSVNNGLRELRGFNIDRSLYSSFFKCKAAIENGYREDEGIEVTIYDDPQVLEDIISLMKDTCGISKKTEHNLRKQINMVYHLSYEECTGIAYDFDMDEKLIEEEEKQILLEKLNSLSSKEREIIFKRFGFNDNKAMTLEEIGKYYGVSKQRIKEIEKKVISRFQHYSCLK